MQTRPTFFGWLEHIGSTYFLVNFMVYAYTGHLRMLHVMSAFAHSFVNTAMATISTKCNVLINS
jgi:hypothetical protein